jgi:hypothetical protein
VLDGEHARAIDQHEAVAASELDLAAPADPL